jgi:glucose/arabinose dehydrogenase
MKYTFVLSTFLFGLLFFACQQKNRPTSSVTAGVDAKPLYAALCSSCHGQQLQQFKSLKTAEKYSAQEIAEFIKVGNIEKGMVAFGENLEENQIVSLSEFIKNYDYTDNQTVVNTADKNYEVETIISDLEIPWGMEFLPNGDMLVAEKKGVLSRFSKEGGLTPITGLPKVRDGGQGGLLDLKLHPNYEENGWLYISYSYIDDKDTDAGNTAIIRAKLEGNQLTNIESIYKGIPAVNTAYHFGNRMVFDKEGYLYLSNGDRGKRDDFPQKLDNSNGKIHRLNDDGSIPADNPFVDTEGAITSIYSYGHRNPQGLVMHPETGRIWEHEHGPKGGDEINLIEKGKNYGWPVISYGINYSGTTFTDITEKEGMEQPLHYYKPSIAPCGMAFVDSDVYPDWKNNLLIGSLSFRYLERVVLNGTQVIYQEKLLEELDSRVRDVRIGPDGYIYVAVEEPGRIIKLIPKS